jgi:hypothetical protein
VLCLWRADGHFGDVGNGGDLVAFGDVTRFEAALATDALLETLFVSRRDCAEWTEHARVFQGLIDGRETMFRGVDNVLQAAAHAFPDFQAALPDKHAELLSDRHSGEIGSA